MKTRMLYYEDAYKTECETQILEVKENLAGGLKDIILDQTVFYPEGGGQPGDRGELKVGDISIKVEYTRRKDGEIVHQGKVFEELNEGAKVLAKTDWNWRYKYMRIHSAGHLVHDVLMAMTKGLKPLKGSHGQKAWLEYIGETAIVKEELENAVNEAVVKDLPIITKESTFEELEKECPLLPPNLPRDKALRMIKIGDYPAMPDGGVQVKSTKEIGKVLITEIKTGGETTVIKYRVVG